MIDKIGEALSPLLPLRLEEVEYNDPMVVLSGPGWSLSVACPWRLMRESRLETAYGAEGAAAALDGLRGGEVVGFNPAGGTCSPGDIRVALGNGAVIEMFADTDLDPWVLRLPEHTFVGTASCV